MNSKNLRTASIVLGIIGLIDSIYLSYIKLTDNEAFCAGIGQCDIVNSSKYAELFGIPIALIGAAGYLVIIVLHLLENQENWLGENAPLMIFGMTLIGVVYSAYLTYIEIAVIHAICPFCVVSAIVMTLMFVIAVWRNLQVE